MRGENSGTLNKFAKDGLQITPTTPWDFPSVWGRNFPSEKLESTLSNLEQEVQKGIQDVLELAQGSDGGAAVLRFSWAAASLAAMGLIKRWRRWTSGWPDGCRGVPALLLLYV